MKIITKALGVTGLALLLASSSAFAAKKRSFSYSRVGLGFSSSTNITKTGSSISPYLELSDKMAVQSYLGIGSTSPFSVGFGTAFKFTLLGDRKAGLHAGAGFGLGSSRPTTVSLTGAGTGTEFFMNAFLLSGVHFSIPNLDSILISLDGGPHFDIAGGSAFNFSLGAVSTLLGLSVHFLL